MPLYISPPPQSPLTALLTAVVAAVVLIGALMLGFVALLIAVSVGAVLWLGILIRLKWAKRQLRKQGIAPAAVSDVVINREESLEAEYTVISTEKDE